MISFTAEEEQKQNELLLARKISDMLTGTDNPHIKIKVLETLSEAYIQDPEIRENIQEEIDILNTTEAV